MVPHYLSKEKFHEHLRSCEPSIRLFPYTHPEKPMVEMCRYCKNEDTKELRLIDDLSNEEKLSYQQYYLKNYGENAIFRIMWCYCCRASWHYLVGFKDKLYKAITFIENDNSGYFFYDSNHVFDGGHIFSVVGLTLPKAIARLKYKGVDPINNFKMSISCYYY